MTLRQELAAASAVLAGAVMTILTGAIEMSVIGLVLAVAAVYVARPRRESSEFAGARLDQPETVEGQPSARWGANGWVTPAPAELGSWISRRSDRLGGVRRGNAPSRRAH